MGRKNKKDQGFSVDYGGGQQGYTANYAGQPDYTVNDPGGQQYGSSGYGGGDFYVMPQYDPNAGQMTVAPQTQEMSGGRKVLTFLGRSVTITLKYFAAKALICIIMGVLAWLAFRVLGIPYAGIFGIVLGIGNFIPVVGEWAAAAIICVPLLLTEPKLALYAAIVMVVLEGIDDFVLTPLIVGRSMSFKPIIVLLMTIAISLAGGSVFGVLFAIPAIAIVKLFLDIFWFKKGLDSQQ